MAQKSNIRSMRFSDEIIQIIESQAGETFTAKFENLVRRCMIELPAKEQELKQIQNEIEREQKRLQTMTRKMDQLDRLIFDTYNLISKNNSTIRRQIEELNNE